MNIQDEAMKIHSKYGTTEKANYEIQLLCEKYAKEYHEQQLKILNIPDVIKSVCGDCLYYLTCNSESRDKQICDNYDNKP